MIPDELSLWSAPFGQKLLDIVPMTRGMKVLDFGSGFGFPMLELAERLGMTSEVYGLDPSREALGVIQQKITDWQIGNAKIIRGFSEAIPFPDCFFDLIVANNGINNVSDQTLTLKECYRVSKPGARLILTVNLPETMTEFYRLFEQTLNEAGYTAEISKMHNHIAEKRKSTIQLSRLIKDAGFLMDFVTTDAFKFRFADGTAFFHHHLIRNAFMPPWKAILPDNIAGIIFDRMEEKINRQALETNGFSVTIPFAGFNARRSEVQT